MCILKILIKFILFVCYFDISIQFQLKIYIFEKIKMVNKILKSPLNFGLACRDFGLSGF